MQEVISLSNSSLTPNDSTVTQNDWDEYISEENHFLVVAVNLVFLVFVLTEYEMRLLLY